MSIVTRPINRPRSVIGTVWQLRPCNRANTVSSMSDASAVAHIRSTCSPTRAFLPPRVNAADQGVPRQHTVDAAVVNDRKVLLRTRQGRSGAIAECIFGHQGPKVREHRLPSRDPGEQDFICAMLACQAARSIRRAR